LAKPSEDGKPLREHLEQVEKQLGRPIEDLTGPEFPDPMLHTWLYFLSISQGRSGGFNGPNPISYPDIKAWAELTGSPVTTREVDVIKRLDAIYIRTMTSNG